MRGNVYVTRMRGKAEEDREDCIQPKFKKVNSVMILGGIVREKKYKLVI